MREFLVGRKWEEDENHTAHMKIQQQGLLFDSCSQPFIQLIPLERKRMKVFENLLNLASFPKDFVFFL